MTEKELNAAISVDDAGERLASMTRVERDTLNFFNRNGLAETRNISPERRKALKGLIPIVSTPTK